MASDNVEAGILEALGLEFGEILGEMWTVRDLDPKEVVIREGDEGRSLFIILSGACQVLRWMVASGETTVVAELTAGRYFGERTFFRGGPYKATVRAAPPPEDPQEGDPPLKPTKTVVAEIKHADLAAKMAENPAFAAAFLWIICQMGCDTLTATTDALTDARAKILAQESLLEAARGRGELPS